MVYSYQVYETENRKTVAYHLDSRPYLFGLAPLPTPQQTSEVCAPLRVMVGAQIFYMEVTMANSLHLYPENRPKLKNLADELGIKPNAVINLLIANAQIGEVVRREPIARLSRKNNRRDASDLTGQSITAIGA